MEMRKGFLMNEEGLTLIDELKETILRYKDSFVFNKALDDIINGKDEKEGLIESDKETVKMRYINRVPQERQERKVIPPVLNKNGAIAKKNSLLSLKNEKVNNCSRCPLSKTRLNIVFGEGDPGARLMFIGEAPGADEDRTGRPFVGRAGQLLTKIIESINLKREDVYIANIIKCRPPENRNPGPDEIKSCTPFLLEQINIIHPEIICTLGNFSTEFLIGAENGPITKTRGNVYDYKGIKVIPTYHPSYLLRNASKKREVWEDMKKIKFLYFKN